MTQMSRKEFSLYLAGRYIETLSPGSIINRALLETYVRGGLEAWDKINHLSPPVIPQMPMMPPGFEFCTPGSVR